jgi:hypothetical protein
MAVGAVADFTVGERLEADAVLFPLAIGARVELIDDGIVQIG